ncbi:MAG: saccharopine dehydrogenase NADP-binding domain-containing protein [Burkholderiales bacterium]|nr:saccharopine dehydrogenase NADP-binding domain-containing protein [Burkholderiales bacterium]
MLTMRVVVIGGHGDLGARICRALDAEPGMEVVAAGRGPGTAGGGGRIRSAQLDIDSLGFTAALKALAPDLVVHCAGPFQGQDYRVAAAAVAAKSHYVDLADVRRFVADFAGRFDRQARSAGLIAVSGASTLPALSTAVMDSIATRFRTLKGVWIVIAPAQRTPRGAATMAGVLGCAGRPFRRLDGGEWKTAWGWQDLRRVRLAGLGKRWAAACDAPDLELLPARYPSLRTVEFHAALETGVQHLGLWLAAALRRAGLALPLERWAARLDRAAGLLDGPGSDRGGMLVAMACERADGSRALAEWHLTAAGGHGSEIPCMAAVILARRLVCGGLAERGAFACMGLVSLAEFEAEFARWGMTTVLKEYPL